MTTGAEAEELKQVCHRCTGLKLKLKTVHKSNRNLGHCFHAKGEKVSTSHHPSTKS
uniref:Uncharacterized protein n=1 Tax=Anguilla anguilla TaxID=7936 RepID=A0A0E9S634_ANGAN